MSARLRKGAPAVSGEGKRFAIVASRTNAGIVDLLLDGAVACLRENGVGDESVAVVRVPGAFELAFAARRAARSGRFDAVIALGAVIRGGTPHFEYVCREAARGIALVGLETDVPVLFGVLTTDTPRQARERAGGRAGNKGREAALAALEMASLPPLGG